MVIVGNHPDYARFFSPTPTSWSRVSSGWPPLTLSCQGKLNLISPIALTLWVCPSLEEEHAQVSRELDQLPRQADMESRLQGLNRQLDDLRDEIRKVEAVCVCQCDWYWTSLMSAAF